MQFPGPMSLAYKSSSLPFFIRVTFDIPPMFKKVKGNSILYFFANKL